MQLIRISLFFITLLEIYSCCYSQPATRDTVNTSKWYQPDFITIQFAGNIGFISAGAGFICWNERYQVSLLYSYIPESVSDATIHLVTLKNSFNLFNCSYKRFNIMPYAGLTGSFETGNNSFLVLPSRFPTGYYPTNAFHATVYLGAKSRLQLNSLQRSNIFEVFVEAGSADVFLFYKIKEKEIRLQQVVSLALGLNFLL